MSCFVCEVCGWSDGHAPGCGFMAAERGIPPVDVRKERGRILEADLAFLEACGIGPFCRELLKRRKNLPPCLE